MKDTFCQSLTVILYLHFCSTPRTSFILKLPTVDKFKICQRVGRSTSLGNSPRCSKQTSEWEVIICHQTPLPVNCCQMLVGAPLPVSLYTRLWQEARQLFGGLPLFKKSAWTGRRWALNKQIINDWTEFQDWRLLWKVQHRSLLLSLSARLKLPPATCGFCAFLQVKQSYLVLTEERLNAINDWHVSEADRMHTHTQTHTHTWADLICKCFTARHLLDVLPWVEVIPFVQGPTQLMGKHTWTEEY